MKNVIAWTKNNFSDHCLYSLFTEAQQLFVAAYSCHTAEHNSRASDYRNIDQHHWFYHQSYVFTSYYPVTVFRFGHPNASRRRIRFACRGRYRSHTQLRQHAKVTRPTAAVISNTTTSAQLHVGRPPEQFTTLTTTTTASKFAFDRLDTQFAYSGQCSVGSSSSSSKCGRSRRCHHADWRGSGAKPHTRFSSLDECRYGRAYDRTDAPRPHRCWYALHVEW